MKPIVWKIGRLLDFMWWCGLKNELKSLHCSILVLDIKTKDLPINKWISSNKMVTLQQLWLFAISVCPKGDKIQWYHFPHDKLLQYVVCKACLKYSVYMHKWGFTYKVPIAICFMSAW